MISVIYAYNNTGSLNRILSPSLVEQNTTYERIPIDNTSSTWKSAASALNHGASLATGKYLMFVHQDVELGSPNWLSATEKILDSILDLGIAGPIGMSREGKDWDSHLRGHICNCGEDIGSPLSEPRKVQTLDECLLLIPRTIFENLGGFDQENFDGWHCYGADFCLSSQRRGYGTYAIPAYIYHRSLARNTSDLRCYQQLLYLKHRTQQPRIYTTSGTMTALNNAISPYTPLLHSLYLQIFPPWLEEIKKATADCQSLLDLGCGFASPACYLTHIPFKTGVEIFPPYLVESQKKAIHNQYISADIRTVSFPPRSFDVVYASEVLEHLNKDEGYQLLERMEMWARNRVILTTPNGYIYQDDYHDNPFQKHKTGWTPHELKSLGYHVQGMGGLKQLRGYKAHVKYNPPFLWERISDVTQLPIRYLPSLAFQLIAIKEVDKK